MQNHKASLPTLRALSSALIAAIICTANTVFAQATLQAQAATTAPSNRAELANTVGELLRLDAAAAVEAEKNKNKGKTGLPIDGLLGGDTSAAINLSKSKNLTATGVEASKTAPVAPVIWLSELSGISGERQLRLNQAGGRSTLFVEGSKTTDAADPQWKLLAVQGRCAQFERTEPVKKPAATSSAKKQPSAKGQTSIVEPNNDVKVTRHEACHTLNPPNQRPAVALTPSLPPSLSYPPLPAPIRP